MRLLFKILFLLFCTYSFINANIVGATKGEFSVNQGTASYNLEIVTPKGVAGLKPSLGISYSSANNFNGVLGVGFSITGLSQISKCNQTLFSEKQDSSRNYNYCLDGQKLVLENSNDTYGETDTEYKTEVDSYSKIKKDTTGWIVYTKDGLKYEYGNSSTSKDGNSFFRVNKISDRYKNIIEFQYDSSSKSIKKISYSNKNINGTDFHNIVNFIYEARNDKRTLYSYGTEFDYKERLKSININTNGVEVSSYTLNYEYIGGQSKVNYIKECAIDDDSLIKCLEPIYFKSQNDYKDDTLSNYSVPESDNNLLVKNNTGIKRMLLDMNGDGLVDKLKVLNEKLYVALNNKNGFDSYLEWDDPNPNFSNNYINLESKSGSGRKLIDVNSDGLVDKLYTGGAAPIGSNTHMVIQFNTGNGFSEPQGLFLADYIFFIQGDQTRPPFITSPLEIITSKNTTFSILDMNGDGYIDRISNPQDASQYKITVVDKKNNKSSIHTDGTKNYQYIQAEDSSGVSQQFIDMNGDKLPDRVINYNHITKKKGLHVALNTGNGFSDFTLWDDRAETEPTFYILKKNSSGTYSQLIDMNGDGLPDRVQHKNYNTDEKGLWVSLNTGEGFADYENWFADFSFTDEKDYYLTKESSGTSASYVYKTFADVDSNGLIDIVFGNDVYFNICKKFVKESDFFFDSPAYISKTDSNGSVLSLLDINGDGYLEKVEAQGDSIKAYKGNYSSKFEIYNITNLKDQDIDIEYATLRELSLLDGEDGKRYISNGKLDYAHRNVKSSPMKVIESFSAANGKGGKNKTEFEYEDFAISLERGSLGFKEVTSIDTTTNTKSITTYKQEYPYIGSVKTNEVYVDGDIISKSENFYENTPRGTSLQVYLKESTEENFDYDTGTSLTTKTTLNEAPDKYGNIGKITTTTKGKDETFIKEVINVYNNDEDNWILSRLDNSTVTHKVIGGDNVINDIKRKSSFKYNSYGTLEKETIEPDDKENKLVKSYSYPLEYKGNKASETVTFKYRDENDQLKEENRTTTYTYDSIYKNISTVKNDLGHNEIRTYNVRNQLIKLEDINGLITEFKYDAMGRKIKEVNKANDTYIKWDYSWTTDGTDGHKVTQTLYAKEKEEDATYKVHFPTTVYYDKLGREIKTEKIGFSGNKIYEKTEYDERGNKSKVFTPYSDGESGRYIEYKYDKVNRLYELRSPSTHGRTAIDKIAYSPFKTIKTNAKGQTKTTIANALGKVTEINDNNQSKIIYEYDAIGNLTKTIDQENNKIEITYDKFGNKESQDDPDMGFWEYKYYPTGELKSQTDAKKQKTNFYYDKLGRISSKTFKEDNVLKTISFKYDTAEGKGLGKIHEEIGLGSKKVYSYDNKGRVKTVTTIIQDEKHPQTENNNSIEYQYVQIYSYDNLGRVLKIKQPNDVTITNNYNKNDGSLESVTTPRETAESLNEDTIREELAYTMQEHLRYKTLAVQYRNQLVAYEVKKARYETIIDTYKNDPDTATSLESLRNSVSTLTQLIDSLKVLVDDYEQRAEYAYDINRYDNLMDFRDFRDGANSEIYQMYVNYGDNLINIVQNSVTFLEELSVKQEENMSLLYCGNIGGITIFCPDPMKNTLGNYEKEDNILYYGTQNEVVSFYESALSSLQGDLSYIGKIKQKIAFYENLSSSQYKTEKNDAYTEILANENKVYFYKVLEKNSLGNITSYISGNGLVTNKDYDERGILYQIKTGYDSSDEDLRDLEFEYDILNNVTKRDDKILNVYQSYGYDSLNRIKSVSTSTAKSHLKHNITYKYDSLGNITYRSDVGHYNYESTRPHAVTSITPIAGGEVKDFEYDANGSMELNAGRDITYTPFNKPTKIKHSMREVDFFYDANDKRYKKYSNSATTHYIGKSYEKVISGDNVYHKYFLYAEGKLVSIFTKTYNVGAINPQYGVKYLHYDNLGSVDSITNQTGVVEERFVYKPFGEKITLDEDGNIKTADSQTNRGYTGHEHIDEFDLIHMNGRVYDPTIGKFLSADPIIQDSKDSQSYNRYSYVRNNPLKYTDPSGYSWFSKIWKKIKKWIKPILAIVVAVLVTLYAPQFLGYVKQASWAALKTLTFGQVVVVGALAGFASGAVSTGSLTGAVKGAFWGAVSAGIAYGIGNALGHDSSFFNAIKDGNWGQATVKAIVHGISRAAITKAQGGRWSSGFWSGFASSGFSVGTKNYGGVLGRTTIMAIVGGTVSEISGGKFANGAVTGAFVHLFNSEMQKSLSFGDEAMRIQNLKDKEFINEMDFVGNKDDIWNAKYKLNKQLLGMSTKPILKTAYKAYIDTYTNFNVYGRVKALIGWGTSGGEGKRFEYIYNCHKASNCSVKVNF